MTIRQLAERTGMTVRNIRAHQTRGLLPPPVVRGRTGYYNDEHVARIELTREMQADGLNLEAIRRVFETSDGSAVEEIFDFTRALRMPFEDETPEIYELSEIATTWGAKEVDPDLIRRGEELGAMRALPDGRIEVISPRLQQAAVELGKIGVRPGGRDRDRREAAPQRRRRGARLRRHLRRGDLGALRPRRPAREGMAADPRGAGADAPARRPGPARRLPDRDGRGRREGERAHAARRGRQARSQKAEKARQTARSLSPRARRLPG